MSSTRIGLSVREKWWKLERKLKCLFHIKQQSPKKPKN